MIEGKILSGGIGFGAVQKLETFRYEYVEKKIDTSLCASEKDKFKAAVAAAVEQIKKLQKKAEIEWGEEKAEVFEGYLGIISDEELENEIFDIIDSGTTADCAVYEIFAPQIEAIKNKNDEYLAARATDLQDMRDRLLKNILGWSGDPQENNSREVIICTEDLTPSQTAQLDMGVVKGLIVNTGGASSHSAIMARTLSLPLILIKKPVAEFKNGQILVVDCVKGVVVEDPSATALEEYSKKMAEIARHKEYLKSLKDQKAITKDGRHFKLFANIGSDDDLPQVIDNGGEGIGLFRTEFLFMGKSSAPSEDNQFRVYRKLAEEMEGKPVIIRTFDFGGDKKIPYLNLPTEENPFLGQRSVRLYEREFELFATQIRAIVRAAAYGNLKIMYPLISSVTELKKINSLAEKVVAGMEEKERKTYQKMEKGIMVETPSSALLADHLIKYCDFFSIGSNDLTQYTLAVDRGNTELLDLFDPFIPAILNLINITIEAAHKAGKWAGLCGELASDINGALILAGWGVDEMSISGPLIPDVKEALRKVSFEDLKKLSQEILDFESSELILNHISNFRRTHNV